MKWEDLTEAEQLQCYVSDTYKDVFGFRPRHYTPEQWNSVEFLQAELDDLHNDYDRHAEKHGRD